MTMVLVSRVSQSRGARKAVSSERRVPLPSGRSARRTPAAVHRAAATVSAEMAQNAARQPYRSPVSVARGSPSSVPSIRPLRRTATARPRRSGRVSWEPSEIATPKNACEATPVITRATTMAG